MTTEANVLLASLTTFGVGGPADVLARPESPEEAAEVVSRAASEGQRLRILGAGSNVLVADEGVRGVVMMLSAGPFKSLSRAGRNVVHVGAGSRLARLVGALADWGLSGAEGLGGIPGTVGGALVMNAGTREGETGALVRQVWALSPAGDPLTLSGPECGFAYRSSDLAGRVLLGAELLLRPGRAAEVRERTDDLLAQRRRSQPRGVRTAGCVFKNPPGGSAGAILDELGCKGLARGEARVSEAHANFIEARQGATAADIRWLIEEMRRRAREARGVELETEIALWGFDDDADERTDGGTDREVESVPGGAADGDAAHADGTEEQVDE
ncbi:MAG: UDP-N-acetylmuramate dehydrogenase [Planctomycetota bacterium]